MKKFTLIFYSFLSANNNMKIENNSENNADFFQQNEKIYYIKNSVEKSYFLLGCHILWFYFLFRMYLNNEKDYILTSICKINFVISPIVLLTKINGLYLLISLSILSLLKICFTRLWYPKTYQPTKFIFQKIFSELIVYIFLARYINKTK